MTDGMIKFVAATVLILIVFGAIAYIMFGLEAGAGEQVSILANMFQ